MKKLLVAALMVLLATPAFAAIQNVKVSGDITESYVDLNSFDLGLTSAGLPVGLKKESDFISQVRLRVDADLSDNVSTTVGLVNERAWNAENTPSYDTQGYNNDTNVQLYLASITLRELLYSPLTVQIGRQVFNYGNGLVLGDGGAINQGTGNLANIDQGLTERTAYDGVTATLDYKPLTISLIYFKNGQNLPSIDGTNVSNPEQNSDVYGYNANYQLNDPWSTVVEQYMFSRINGSGFGVTTGNDAIANQGKGSTLYVPGLRASTNPYKGLNVQGELAWQLGNNPVNTASGNEAEHRDAMAAQFLASYSLPVLDKYKPTVNASYTYVSGDKNTGTNYPASGTKSSKTDSAWDEFNTIQGAGTIYRAILPLSNENIFSAGATVAPLEDVTVGATWTGLWAVDKYTNDGSNTLNIFQPDTGAATLAVPVSTKKNTYGLGNETDVNVTYNYTEDVTFGVSLGWYVPGSAFASANRETASQAVANVGVKF
jgi:hypothetical protein